MGLRDVLQHSYFCYFLFCNPFWAFRVERGKTLTVSTVKTLTWIIAVLMIELATFGAFLLTSVGQRGVSISLAFEASQRIRDIFPDPAIQIISDFDTFR